ncbi:MAG: phosphate transport system substrate-binding protein [Acidimicrobiaceae bacterium]
MRLRRRVLSGLVALCALALLGTACEAANPSATDTRATGTAGTAPANAAAGAKDTASLSGAGSTFVQSMLQEWIKQYARVAPGVSINYQGVGSGAGIQQLTSKTVDFAGSDVALKAGEKAATGGPGAVVAVPWVAGGIAVEYNLAKVKSLKLSPDTVAGIFSGRIAKWNDAAIKADNPGAPLPKVGIQVVHRSDGSGTTQVFTSYLKAAAAPGRWNFPTDKDWHAPAGTGAKGSDGVTQAVKQSPGAIGYADVSFPKLSSLGMVEIRNQAGQFVAPTAAGVTAALAEATPKDDGSLTMNYTPTAPTAYPISTTTYLLFARAGDPTKTQALRHFAQWALTDGQNLTESLDYAPLPPPIVTAALASVSV